jgi:hypothetical protein
MDLTYGEATAIDKVRRMVGLWRRNILTETEIVRGVVMELVQAGDGAERVIPHCVAALSPELRGRLFEYVRELATREYRGWYFVIGPGLNEQELEGLRLRCQSISEAIVTVLREAEGRLMSLDQAAAIGVDVFWARFRDQPTAGNPPCRSAECTALSLNASIYCARHHYEQIVGRTPPEG